MKKKYIKYVLKVVVFTALFVILFNTITKLVTAPDYKNYQWIAGFYEEEEDTLDAVYFGSSNCYTFWNPVIAWEEYGITVYPYSCNAQPFTAAMHLIEETRKTQPNAMFIVNTSAIGNLTQRIDQWHYLLDYMPFSLTKAELINHLADGMGYSWSERMELYFPIIRYHSRWDRLKSKDFNYEVNGLKGAPDYQSYLAKSKDIAEGYASLEVGENELSEMLVDYINELLDYCDEEQVKVLFVTVPRCDDGLQARIDIMNEMIEERGYPVLDLRDDVDEITLDLETDYYDGKHTNIHGAIKYTQYLSEYLIENYGFEDKRGNEAYSSWDEASEKYAAITAPYVLDIEKDREHRAPELAKPDELTAVSAEAQVKITWQPVEGADGYAVYRKNAKAEPLQQITEVTECEYLDAEVWENGEFTYTVVPFYEEAEEKYYGDFSYAGVTIKVK